MSEQRRPEAMESFVCPFDKLLRWAWARSQGQVCWMKVQHCEVKEAHTVPSEAAAIVRCEKL